jgi:hypothetical protein
MVSDARWRRVGDGAPAQRAGGRQRQAPQGLSPSEEKATLDIEQTDHSEIIVRGIRPSQKDCGARGDLAVDLVDLLNGRWACGASTLTGHRPRSSTLPGEFMVDVTVMTSSRTAR